MWRVRVEEGVARCTVCVYRDICEGVALRHWIIGVQGGAGHGRGGVEGWGHATAAGDGGGRQRGAVILILGAGWSP